MPGTWKPGGVPAAEEVAARRAAEFVPREARATALLERTKANRARQRSAIPWAERELVESRGRAAAPSPPRPAAAAPRPAAKARPDRPLGPFSGAVEPAAAAGRGSDHSSEYSDYSAAYSESECSQCSDD